MNSFTNDILHINDIVVYLKNERTGSSTIRKCKFIGHINGFTDKKVEITRLSPPDIFVTLEECKDYGIDTVYPEDIVHIVESKYQEEDNAKMLGELCNIIDKRNKDIKLLLGNWFLALEDEGVDPWMNEDCMIMAKKYLYVKEDYEDYLSTIK